MLLHRIKQVTDAAERGNAKSMFKLGLHYSYLAFREDHEDKNFEAYLQSLYWLSEAAHANVWEAYYWLGCNINDFGRLCSGGPYFMRFLEDVKKNNPIYLRIIEKLHAKGLNEESDVDAYKVNIAFIFLYRTFLLGSASTYDYSDLGTSFIKIAAEHKLPRAEAEFGRRAYICLCNWCRLLPINDKIKALTILNEHGKTNADIMKFYDDAKYWLLKAISDGEDYAAEYLNELSKRKNDIAYLSNTITSKKSYNP